MKKIYNSKILIKRPISHRRKRTHEEGQVGGVEGGNGRGRGGGGRMAVNPSRRSGGILVLECR